MKRMTSSNYNPCVNCIYSSSCSHIKYDAPVCPERARYYHLAAIEDILGDDYDLDRLRELVEADRECRNHIGRCVECSHYEGLAVCEFLGDCGGTNWICGWFEPRQAAEIALKGEQNESQT